MLILSKFKDYYDYHAHQYGIDSLIVNDRTNISNTNISFKFDGDVSFRDTHVLTNIQRRENTLFRLSYLFYCGTIFPLYSESPAMFHSWTSPKLLSKEIAAIFEVKYYTRPKNILNEDLTLNSSYDILFIHKQLKRAVLLCDVIDYHGKRIEINCKIPSLADIGFPTIKDSFCVYKDITKFIGENLIENSDKLPPVELSNNDKIHKAGFDVKKSFRHRKE